MHWHNCCCRSPCSHLHHWSVSLPLRYGAVRTDIHSRGSAPHRLCYSSLAVQRLSGNGGSDSHTLASLSSFVSSLSSSKLRWLPLPPTTVFNPSLWACAAKCCCTPAQTTSQSVTMVGSAIA